MRFRSLLAIALLSLLPAAAGAQALIQLSSASLIDNNGALLNGSVVLTVVDSSGNPATYTPQGGSPSTAVFTDPIVNGKVKDTNQGPYMFLNTLTASPSGLLFHYQLKNAGGTVILNVPKVAMYSSTGGYSLDSYIAAAGSTISGLGYPRTACQVSAIYNQTDAPAGAKPWICSLLFRTDGSLQWTQNPSSNPQCQNGNAVVSPRTGNPYCILPENAFGLPGEGLQNPDPANPGPLQMAPITGGISGHLTPNKGAGVDNSGHLSPLPEISYSTDGSGLTSFLCQEDRSAGIYDARCPQYGGIYGSVTQQLAAANALMNQVACDAHAGLIQQAEIRYPQGTFYWDNVQIPPGAWVHGVPNSIGGTTIRSAYNGRQIAVAPPSMTATCNGTTYTVSGINTKVSDLYFFGCGVGGCVVPPAGYSTFVAYSTTILMDLGLDMQSSSGVVENVYTSYFGGFGLRASGQDTKVYHCRGYSDNESYYFGTYNGAGDNTGPFGVAWHGGHELFGQDIVVDGDEVYGRFDSPTAGTYQHLADILVGGGIAYFDHLWPQLGQVGIVSPGSMGTHVLIVNAKVDFSRTYGVFGESQGFQLRDSQIDGACTAGNAATINTTGGPYAGTCESLFTSSPGADITNVVSDNNNGFGPSFKTADFLVEFGVQHNLTGNFEFVNTGPTYGQNMNWEPQNPNIGSITAVNPTVDLVQWLNPTDSVAATYTSFNHVMQNQDFYLQGGNTNVTINNNPPYIVLSGGANLSMASVKGFIHFRATAGDAFGLPGHVTQVGN